jgi:hypothetical protein
MRHLAYTLRYSVASINSSLLIITLHCSVIKQHSFITTHNIQSLFMTLQPSSTVCLYTTCKRRCCNVVPSSVSVILFVCFCLVCFSGDVTRLLCTCCKQASNSPFSERRCYRKCQLRSLVFAESRLLQLLISACRTLRGTACSPLK